MKILVFVIASILSFNSIAAVDPDKGLFGGLWVRTSKPAEINLVWNRLAAPIYDDAYNGTSSTPGVWIQAFLPKRVVISPNVYDFSVLKEILNSTPIKKHGGNVGIELRMEGKAFPRFWRAAGYTFTPKGKKREILNLGKSAARIEFKKYLKRFAAEANNHPNIKFLCIGEMSGSAPFAKARIDIIKELADDLDYAYACVKQNNDIWDDIKDYPGVMKAVAGPKLAESGCGSSGKNWPIFDCRKDSRYSSFQWGNILGEKPPSKYPEIINVAAIEPNEFRMLKGGIGKNNPWGIPLPDSSLSAGKFNINNKVALWWLSGEPRFPQNAKKHNIKAVPGIMPSPIIALGISRGINWDGRIKDLHDAVRMFGFNGTGQLFPDFKDSVPVKKACDDGLDNDEDGLIDLDDPGCLSAKDNNETDPIPCTGYEALIDLEKALELSENEGVKKLINDAISTIQCEIDS